jgi:hypothetical protein
MDTSVQGATRRRKCSRLHANGARRALGRRAGRVSEADGRGLGQAWTQAIARGARTCKLRLLLP